MGREWGGGQGVGRWVGSGEVGREWGGGQVGREWGGVYVKFHRYMFPWWWPFCLLNGDFSYSSLAIPP